MSAKASPPLFILSPRKGDDLIRLTEAAGWRPVAALRIGDAESRFVASGAGVALVDAREAYADALDGVRALSAPVEVNGAALLVLVSAADAAGLDELFGHGATHFLVAPFSDLELLQALRFAGRLAERVGRAHRSVPALDPPDRRALTKDHPGPPSTAAPSVRADDAQRSSLMELFRRFDPESRRAARAADLNPSTGDESPASRDGSEAPRHDPSRDQLTGLRDLRAGRAWIDERIAAGSDEQPALVLLLLAVSRFDAINAAFGRTTGDAVLQAAARRIERLVAPDMDRRFVARFAGPEFGVILSSPTSLGEGRFLAGQLVEALARPFMSGDHVITLTSRVGVVASAPGDDSATLLRRASAALADAKKGEGGPIRILDAGARRESALGDQLEIDLRRALDQDEIEILFQPQVSVTSGRIVGAEALARWRHPSFGELGATTLFNVAERSDYLTQLSDHVQRKAITAAAAWPATLSRLRLSVNITAADIVRPGFASQFLELVRQSAFDPRRLTVEVTEGGLIEDLNAAAYLLARLREGGLRVAIDDFGTGYSSLAYLKALPLDYLKIDKRLCEDITGSPRDRIVVRSVIDMARSLGLSVIAEGVETQEQLDLLAQEGCNLYQGFLCSRPVEVAALAALMDPAIA
ncbi:MAG TPA: bifunctional diguanylate cyclase/phosphodiesterase [Allosphingosinicella sp.]|jgi:diguanylate cyclase (GGDEF)-like protein|uniref:putative bifunctional diguanylate cyclase/phosphodiesterase n=1 Tax=Allosphingosinicella sp. TaxID=2823234 RepID=UPI002F2992B2